MAGLLYFVAGDGREAAKTQRIEELGLKYAFGDRPPTPCPVSKGPCGGPGVVMAIDADLDGHALGYYPDKQTWLQIFTPSAALPAQWVGCYTDSPPTPEQLQRKQLLPGHLVTLGDGHRWEIPIARTWLEEDGQAAWLVFLPRRMTLDEEGQFTPGNVLPQYGKLWDASAGYFDRLTAAIRAQQKREEGKGKREEGKKAGEEEEGVSFLVDEDTCVDVLAANYRVGRAEVVLLGLLTWNGPHARNILEAAIDLPGWRQIQKKLESAGSGTGSGSADATRVTAPA